MSKYYSVSLTLFISLFHAFLLPNECISQIIPSLRAVHAKKGSSLPEQSSSLTFDGSNDKVTTNLSMNNWSAFTYEVWVYPESSGSREGVVGHNDIIEFGFNPANRIHFWTAKGSQVNWNFNSSTSGNSPNTCISSPSSVKLLMPSLIPIIRALSITFK